MRAKSTNQPVERWLRKQAREHAQAAFIAQCERFGLPTPVPEFKFSVTRRWKFDFAFVSVGIAVEIEGGAWTHGRHTRGAGFMKDMEKYNTATCAGWRILRATPKMVESEEIFRLVATTILRRKIGV